ncbi:hypothetical protein RRG08_009785 [Elysia crispata]|uniref:Uncharacterized protein n=1 Tax=Elysia crispata TaxID=231223 RepID=A0AAE0ZR82_9GAST|nr:hypothetical protein RRG08_009785 [Elysia crispata]
MKIHTHAQTTFASPESVTRDSFGRCARQSVKFLPICTSSTLAPVEMFNSNLTGIGTQNSLVSNLNALTLAQAQHWLLLRCLTPTGIGTQNSLVSNLNVLTLGQYSQHKLNTGSC